MGIRDVTGRVVGAAKAAAQSDAGQRVAGIAREVATNPELRSDAIKAGRGMAAALALPGPMGKTRALKHAVKVGRTLHAADRAAGGGQAPNIQNNQFGHLPPPPLGGLPNPPASAPAPWEPGGSFGTPAARDPYPWEPGFGS